jgi:hypothetical protein
MTSGEILYMDSGIVKMVEEGLAIDSFRELYEGDKNKGKPMFKKYIEALWRVYSKDAPYYFSTSVQERISEYNRKVSDKKGWSSLVKDERFNKCVQDYIKHVKNRYDIQYEKLMDDIDTQIEYLQNIPMTRKGKRTTVVENEDGSKENIIVEVDIPNIDERTNAYKIVKELYKTQDDLQERMKQEGKKIIKKYVRIFDNPDS